MTYQYYLKGGCMKKFIVCMSENNSGGSFYLSKEDYRRLEEAGWELDRNEDSYRVKYHDGHPDHAYRTVFSNSEDQAYEEAVGEFEAVTGAYRYLEMCNCCGQNFWFNVEEDEYTSEEEFADAVKAAMEAGMDVFDMSAIIQRVFIG